MKARTYDIVLYGASGFVGRQTVAYFAQHAGVQAAGLRWALAGRNRGKLEQVQREVGGAAMQAGLVVAAADDASALDELAANAAVVLSTAGPFSLYGTELVAACVANGTHYVDITGETPWVAGLIAQHHAQARSRGVRIVPFCGFDSVPSDIGTWMMMQAMQQRHQVPASSVKAAHSLRGGLNGGTFASVANILGGPGARQFADPFLLDPPGPRPADVKAHADVALPTHDADFKAWLAPFFMAPINTRVVRRSAALLDYGPAFGYQEYLRVGGGLLGGAGAAAMSAGMGAGQLAMTLAPVRRLAARAAPKPGEGPSESAMNAGWFRCELVARSAAGKVLRGRVAGQGDPGNRATTKMLCESALALALDFDTLPGGAHLGGVLTPASALGEALVRRLRLAGLVLEVDA